MVVLFKRAVDYVSVFGRRGEGEAFFKIVYCVISTWKDILRWFIYR